MTTFTVHSIPDLTGQTAIVTGASSGIGLATARTLAAAGARVVFAIRDPAKGGAAAAATPGLTEVRRLDLASLLFTAELQRRLAAAGSGVLANAAHPGLVATSIYHHDGPRRPADMLWTVAIRLLAQDPARGALPVL